MPQVPASSPRSWPSRVLPYGVAAASAAACLAVARLAEPFTSQWEVMLLLYFAPAVLGAWQGGLGPGLFATALVAGAMAYGGQPGDGSTGIARMGRLSLFVAEAGLLAYLTGRARLATDAGRRYRAAEETSRLKDDFLAALSHELRAPLSTIVGWARVLRSGSVDHETTVKALESIERSVDAQTALIDHLLDFSHLLSGRVRLEVGSVQPAPLIAAAVEAVRAAASAKAIGLEVELDPRAGRIAGDPARLQQIVRILVSHAVGVTPTGGGVRVTLESRGPGVEIRVSDTGPGIAPDRLAHVFEPFRRADGASAAELGALRLGLAVARHLTELQGGAIRVESPGIGWGATFTLSFPVRGPGDDAGGLERGDADESRAGTARPAARAVPGTSTSSRA